MTSTKNRFYFLLGGLLIVLLVAPMTMERFPAITSLMLTAALLVSVFSMSVSRRMYMAAWLLVITKIILTAIAYLHPNTAVFTAETVVLFAFFLLAATFAIQRVLDGDYVDMNRIAGAISIYMLIGLIWSCLYFFVSLIEPQAFNGLPDLSTDDVRNVNAAFMDLLYYSYVSLSTLGYGDITPVSRAAQSLAYLEAICGVMYVAVLVAALVGSYGNKRVAQA
jgi:voltage-gated potassium channel